MMVRKISLFVLLLGVLLLENAPVQAQDHHTSHFFANPLYINPAFAGAKELPRISVGYRNQWPNLGGGFSFASLSYDQHINAIRGGLGAYIVNDRQGGNHYMNTMVHLIYSYRFAINDQFNLRLGVQAGYVNRYINWNELTFPDQYDPVLGFIGPTEEVLPQTPMSKSYADFAAGFLAYGTNYYVGFSASHLSMPDQGFMGIQRLPMKFTAHVGGVIYFNKRYNEKRRERDISLSPNVIYTHQGKIEELSYGLYLKTFPMTAGVWYRHSFSNSDAIVLLLGMDYKGITIAYSYDITVSKLKGSGGAHEITLGYTFNSPRPRTASRNRGIIPCPSF